MITIKTSKGDIQIQLDKENTPETAANFLKYIEEGFYKDTIFHRVIPGFMIQGGGMTADLQQKSTNAGVKNEGSKTSKPNKRGTLAMARTSDPHSATAQFFINLTDNAFLNFSADNTAGYGYCVFGEVVNGMDVVDAIARETTTTRMGHADVPVDNVVINDVVVEEQA